MSECIMPGATRAASRELFADGMHRRVDVLRYCAHAAASYKSVRPAEPTRNGFSDRTHALGNLNPGLLSELSADQFSRDAGKVQPPVDLRAQFRPTPLTQRLEQAEFSAPHFDEVFPRAVDKIAALDEASDQILGLPDHDNSLHPCLAAVGSKPLASTSSDGPNQGSQRRHKCAKRVHGVAIYLFSPGPAPRAWTGRVSAGQG